MTAPSIPQRLWFSGLFHVMAGSVVAAIIIQMVGKLFGHDFGLW